MVNSTTTLMTGIISSSISNFSATINNTSTIGTTVVSSPETSGVVSTKLTAVTSVLSSTFSTLTSAASALVSNASTAVTGAGTVANGSLEMVGNNLCRILSNVNLGGNISFSFYRDNMTLQSCNYSSSSRQDDCIRYNVSFANNASVIINSISLLADTVANCANVSGDSHSEEEVSYANSCGGFGNNGKTELVLGMVTAFSIFVGLCAVKRCLKATKRRFTRIWSNISARNYDDDYSLEIDHMMNYRNNQDNEEDDEHIYEEVADVNSPDVNLVEGRVEPVVSLQHGVLS